MKSSFQVQLVRFLTLRPCFGNPLSLFAGQLLAQFGRNVLRYFPL